MNSHFLRVWVLTKCSKEIMYVRLQNSVQFSSDGIFESFRTLSIVLWFVSENSISNKIWQVRQKRNEAVSSLKKFWWNVVSDHTFLNQRELKHSPLPPLFHPMPMYDLASILFSPSWAQPKRRYFWMVKLFRDSPHFLMVKDDEKGSKNHAWSVDCSVCAPCASKIDSLWLKKKQDQHLTLFWASAI